MFSKICISSTLDQVQRIFVPTWCSFSVRKRRVQKKKQKWENEEETASMMSLLMHIQ